MLGGNQGDLADVVLAEQKCEDLLAVGRPGSWLDETGFRVSDQDARLAARDLTLFLIQREDPQLIKLLVIEPGVSNLAAVRRDRREIGEFLRPRRVGGEPDLLLGFKVEDCQITGFDVDEREEAAIARGAARRFV